VCLKRVKGSAHHKRITHETNTRKRPSGQRDGWEFVPVDVPNARWSMTDTITYRLPGHTEAKPNVYTETLQAAISEAYHNEWYRYSRLERLDKKDKAAGKQLVRD